MMSVKFFEVGERFKQPNLNIDFYFELCIGKNNDFYFVNMKTEEIFERHSKVELLPGFANVFGERQFTIYAWAIDPSLYIGGIIYDNVEDGSFSPGYELVDYGAFLGGKRFDGKYLMAYVDAEKTKLIYMYALKNIN